MAPRLSVQLYSVRDQVAALDVTLERLAASGFDAVEPFNVLDGELGPALARHGLEAPSAQFPFLSDDIDFLGSRVQLPERSVVFEAAAALNVRLLVDPMVEAARWQDLDDVKRTAERLNIAVDEAAAFDLKVGYHNHTFEFHARFGGVTAYECFAGELDERAALELDVYWAAVAGEDVPQLIERLGPQVRALHVKDGSLAVDSFAGADDYDPESLDQRPAGDGDVGIADVLLAAPDVDLDVIEFDHCAGDVFEAIDASARLVRQIRLG